METCRRPIMAEALTKAVSLEGANRATMKTQTEMPAEVQEEQDNK
jgi:hypothetical protein